MLSKRSSSEPLDAVVISSPGRKLHAIFNPTLFRKNFTRFWPIWLSYTLIWFLSMPAQIFMESVNAARYGWDNDTLVRWAERTVLNLTGDIGIGLSLCFGLMAAVAVYSYLFNPRSTGLMHTLPIYRGGLYFTNYLSGLSFLLVPNLVIALLTWLAELSAGVVNGWNVVMWLLIQCGLCFFFYTFAVFCGMFTGHTAAMPAFYAIFNVLAVVLWSLVSAVMDMFVFGYSNPGIPGFVEWLTPVQKLATELRFRTVPENGVEVTLFTGYQYVLAYCGIALVLAIACLYLYEARHMETAGDVIALPWAKPLFKYGFAFCAALCGGFLLYYIFGNLMESERVFFTLVCALCGILGCLIAEMLLQKSFKVFRKKVLLSCGIFAACIVLLLTGLSNDLMGVASRVPAPGRVTAAYINGSSLPPYDSGNASFLRSEDSETIKEIIALHEAIVDDREFYEALDSTNRTHLTSNEDWVYHWIEFQYTLWDGSTLSRHYSIPLDASKETPDPDSVEGRYLALLGDPQVLLEEYFPDEAWDATPITGSIRVYDRDEGAFRTVKFTPDQTARLAEAAREDIAAGRLGIRYLSEASPAYQTNCAYDELRLEWTYTTMEKVEGINSKGEIIPTTETASRYFSSNITPQYTATSLMTALHETGALDENRILISWADYEQNEFYIEKNKTYYDNN